MQVDTGSVNTFVETFGNERQPGPIVVLLHGNPDSSFLWRDVVRKLGDRCRTFAPDLPGFGRSKITGPYDYSLDSHVSWLDAVLQGLGDQLGETGFASRIHLAVHDLGGPYGLAWATRRPEQVAAVLACDTVFFADYRWHLWARLWRTPGLGELCMPLMGWHFFRWLVRRHSPTLSDEYLTETWRWVSPSMKRTVLKLYRATDPSIFADWQEPCRSLLASLPSVALWGARDPFIAPHWAHHLGAQRVRVVPGCGHWLPAEAPDLVARELLELVREAAGGDKFSRHDRPTKGAFP